MGSQKIQSSFDMEKKSRADDLIRSGLNRGQRALSEYESKKLLGLYDIPVTREKLSHSADEAVSVAEGLGFPVALKACSAELMHKSERGGIELNLRSEGDVREAYGRVLRSVDLELEGVLVQEMVLGQRELVVGLNRDSQFGSVRDVGNRRDHDRGVSGHRLPYGPL